MGKFLFLLAVLGFPNLISATSNRPDITDIIEFKTLKEEQDDSLLFHVMDCIGRGAYVKADSLLKTISPNKPSRHYFRGIVLFTRFNDWGDSIALKESQKEWEWVLAQTGNEELITLYRGLASLQLSYVAQVQHRTVAAAFLGRKAATQLRPLSNYVEAQSALALYDYYFAVLMKKLDWLPFTHSDTEKPKKLLENTAIKSRYLSTILQTSLIWLYYDAKTYDKGLSLIQGFLLRYPENRMYKQIQGDFFYRKGDFINARASYENSREKYAQLNLEKVSEHYLPLGYLCAVGNLIRINEVLHDNAAKQNYLHIWSTPQNQAIKPWLPESLTKDLQRFE